MVCNPTPRCKRDGQVIEQVDGQVDVNRMVCSPTPRCKQDGQVGTRCTFLSGQAHLGVPCFLSTIGHAVRCALNVVLQWASQWQRMVQVRCVLNSPAQGFAVAANGASGLGPPVF